MKQIKEKQKYCDFMANTNDFFERLFKIPIKLKKYDK